VSNDRSVKPSSRRQGQLLRQTFGIQALFKAFFCLTVFSSGIISVAFFFDPSARAASLPLPDRTDFGPTTLTLGGAAAALTTAHDAFMTNPATLVFFQGFDSIGSSWQILPKDESHWSVSVADGTRGVTGGFQFQWADVQEARRLNLAVGAAYKTPWGSVGVTGHTLRIRGVDVDRGWHFTDSIGIFIPLFGGLTLGAYSKSPFDFNDHRRFPTSLHMGAGYSYPGSFRVAFESDRRFRLNHQSWNYSVGGDILPIDYIALRGGYHWDRTEQFSYWAAGLILVAPRIEVAGSFLRKVNGETGNGFSADFFLKF